MPTVASPTRQAARYGKLHNVTPACGLAVRGRRWQSERGRPMLRRQLFLLAGRWCGQRGLLRDDYLRMLERNGGRPTKAVAAIARKLLPGLFAVM